MRLVLRKPSCRRDPGLQYVPKAGTSDAQGQGKVVANVRGESAPEFSAHCKQRAAGHRQEPSLALPRSQPALILPIKPFTLCDGCFVLVDHGGAVRDQAHLSVAESLYQYSESIERKHAIGIGENNDVTAGVADL